MHLPVIVKVSKFCNLRCHYCYEFPELGNRDRISLEDIEHLFVQIRDYLLEESTRAKDHHVDFFWHGGEPFAQPLAYWKSIIHIQQKIFGRDFQRKVITNFIQSNLTLVTERHLPLLKRYFRLGFSYDVVNTYRKNLAGMPTDTLVLKKLDWLLSKKVHVGGIAVITQANVGQPEEVARFFLNRDVGFRLLNLYESVDLLPQVREASVSFDDYLEFLRRIYQLAETRAFLGRGDVVEPLSSSLRLMKRRHQKGRRLSLKACAEREWSLGVNTNGDVYSCGDLYKPDYCYGNIFRQSLPELLTSKGRQRRVRRSCRRIKAVCQGCPFFGRGCVGTFVSHATEEDYREFEKRKGCYASLGAKMIEEFNGA